MHYLKQRGLIEENEREFSLIVQEADEDYESLDEYVGVIASQDLPLSIDQLVEKVGHPVGSARAILKRLQNQGRIEVIDDAIVNVDRIPDIVALSNTSAMLSLIMTCRTVFGVIRGRLAEGRDDHRILVWTFAAARSEKILAKISSFRESVDSEWEETEPENRREQSKFRLFLGWRNG